MDRAEIERVVLAFIHEQKTMDEDALTLDTDLDSVGIDSLDALKKEMADSDARGVQVPNGVEQVTRDRRRVTAERTVMIRPLS